MAVDGLIWQSSKKITTLMAGQIHVWRASLELDEVQKETLLGLLSADELERAQGFYFEKDRNQFIAARGILRCLIGMYLNLLPQNLQFEYSPYGKPSLQESKNYHDLYFNLSHSKQLALYAFAHHPQLGIDLEWVRDDLDDKAIARHFFSTQEINILEHEPEYRQKNLFFQYWTRKEALIKAMGKGVSFPLDECDVSRVGATQWHPIQLSPDAFPWYVQDLYAAENYCAAIAGTQHSSKLVYWQYEP